MSKESFLEDPEIDIGVVGNVSSIRQVKRALQSFPTFKPLFCIGENSLEMIEEIEKLTHEVEVLLFSDYYFYKVIEQKIDSTVPLHYIPIMGTGLYRSLSILNNHYDVTSLSVDTIEKKYVQQILHEFEEENCQVITYKQNYAHPNIENIITFHKVNFQKNQSIALTGIQEVSKQLTVLNIPHKWVTPTQQDIIVSLERALLATETRKNKESQIVLGLMNVDDFRGITTSYTSEHDVQVLKLNIQQMLLDYIRQLDGHLINLGGEEYLFITTRGMFERKTRGYKFIPILQDIKSELGVELSIGVGFGTTASEAGVHARLALQQSKDVGGKVCYIVREDRSVIGPVDITSDQQYEKYNLAITDPELLERAEKAGMSASYMTMLMARVVRHKKIDYTAQELAATLKVTVRSAHRILLKWMDADLVDIIGEERVTHRGRPRRIYRLTFISEEDLKRYEV